MIKLLLAEDQGMVRGALKALLNLEPDIEVVAEAADGIEAVTAARHVATDVALLDIEMPGKDGIEATAEILAARPDCKVMILTTFGKPGLLRRAMESGASAFLVKDGPAPELAAAIRRVLAGERVIDPALAAAALSAGPNRLTPRERDVLRASVDGSSINAISARLNLAPGTVRNYLSLAMRKLDARNRIEAVRVAQRYGWL